MVDLDVDNADAQRDFFINFLQRIQICFRAMSQLENKVVGVQAIKKFNKLFPIAFLSGLAPVGDAPEKLPGKFLALSECEW
ncbi:MAG: hypothetical protein ABIP97_00360 [Chthoniobacterales bacterium]